MMEWWNDLAVQYQIFYGVGIIATLLLFIQLIMTLIGAGDHMDFADGGGFDLADAGGLDVPDGGLDPVAGPDIEHGSGLQILSLRTVVAFLAGFGWTGAFALRQGVSTPMAVLLACAVGFILMLLVYFMMRMLYGMRYSGTLNLANAVGQVGDVYIRIPGARTGEGQVQVLVQGRLSTFPACTSGDEDIPSGRKVRVLGLEAPRTLVVESIKKVNPDQPIDD